jgi:hypothetical protein
MDSPFRVGMRAPVVGPAPVVERVPVRARSQVRVRGQVRVLVGSESEVGAWALVTAPAWTGVGRSVTRDGGEPAARAPPLAPSPDPAVVTARDPFRSVRLTRAPTARMAASVRGDGCPYGLSAPQLIMAMRGCSRRSSSGY